MGAGTRHQLKVGTKPTGTHKPQDKEKIAKHRAVLNWWFGTVILTLFPTLLTILVVVLEGEVSLSWDVVLGDGEIILASFLIVASTAMSSYTDRMETAVTDLVRNIMIFLGIAQAVSYAIIKTNDTNASIVLIIVSFVALVISVCTSWIWFTLTNRGA